MDTVTYLDKRTIDFINEFLVPVRVYVNALPSWAYQFTIQYTPTVLILDEEKKEHHRSVGFFPPEEFIPSLFLGIAKAQIYTRQIVRARGTLAKLLQVYPRSRAAGEALKLQSEI